MTWFGWLLIIMQLLSVALSIALIGRDRGKYTPEYALASMITGGLIVWGILTVGTGHA